MNSIRTLGTDSIKKSPSKVSFYNKDYSNGVDIYSDVSKRNLSLVQRNRQISNFNIHKGNESVKNTNKASFKGESVKKDNRGFVVSQRDLWYNDLLKGKATNEVYSHKYIINTASKPGTDIAKAQKLASVKKPKPSHRADQLKDCKKANLATDFSLLSIEDMTQSDILGDKTNKEKRTTLNKNKLTGEKVKTKTNINNLLQLVRSDKKLAANRKQLGVG